MSLFQTLRAYYHDISTLTKAGLAFSVLLTILPAMLVGPALPSPSLVVLTLVGTWLVACAAFVYNQIVEVDRDSLMERTQERPLVRGSIHPIFANIFGSTLLGIGLYILIIGAGHLAALIALGSFLYYILAYTIFLKPRTQLNTSLGGIAGSVGPLIGEAAVTGKIGEYGIAMFLLLFLWQPAHFWCLAIRYKKEYQRAGIPVLPVATNEKYTIHQMLIYQSLLCITFLAVSLPPLHLTGLFFLIPSLGFGLLVLFLMLRLRYRSAAQPMSVFFMTIVHMIIWHLALTLDLYLRFWH